MPKYSLYLLVLVLFAVPLYCRGQAEIDQERSSLHGLNGVGFNVNVEQNLAFTDNQIIKIATMRQEGRQKLRQADIRLYSDQQIEASTRIPVLYLHINSLGTKSGIISFAVTASLYQPVKLILNGDDESSASTWESSVVGIASYDKIGVIKQAAMGIIQNFIDDYYKANPN